MTAERSVTPTPTGNSLGAAANQSAPSPALVFDTINAYQRTAAIKAAIELDLFAAMAATPAPVEIIARHCRASPRGIRILCDYLTVIGLLTKSGDQYALTPDTALFLNPKSPAYVGGTLEFLLSNEIKGAFDHLADAARKGGTARSPDGTVAREHPVWISFARSMGPLMAPAAARLADLIALDQNRPTKVLDISASHGVWGNAFAAKNRKAHIVALDWAPVLERNLRGEYPSTPATAHFFGLSESLAMISEEGLSNIFERHARLAEAYADERFALTQEVAGPRHGSRFLAGFALPHRRAPRSHREDYSRRARRH